MSVTWIQSIGPASRAGGRSSTHWPMRPGASKSGWCVSICQPKTAS